MTDKSNSRICLTVSVFLLVLFCVAAPAKTIYVDIRATGANDGSSWTNAYMYLQEALLAAKSAEKPVEIRVAQGTYRPNQGLFAIPEFDWRTTTFQLINGVALKGGYAGLGQPDPNARDIKLYETILSGDLNGDDEANFANNQENSYHVVTSSGTDETAIINGISICAGNANISPLRDGYFDVVRSCGGGMYNISGNSTVSNCRFRANCANWNGGGIYNSTGSPTLTNCVFEDNLATNEDLADGGAMYNRYGSNPVLVNCVFIGNTASWRSGISSSWDSNPAIINCTFTGNRSKWIGGGVISSFDGCSVLTNCILWDNTAPQISGDAIVTYSNVHGGWEGEGNIDADPMFADAGRWVDANDPNIVAEPNDPNAVWVDGDYHLKSQGGRWDPNSQSWIKDDVTSPCIDAGDPNSPIGDEPEPNGGRINMGAYGGTKEASKSPPASPIVYIQWLGHSSVKLWAEDCIVYVDPQRLNISPHDATLVCVTHTHGDHYSPADIARVSNNQTQFVGPPDVVQRYGKGQTIAPGQTIESYCARLVGVAAYNTNKTNHPKTNKWVGYIVELGGKRIYVAGDTDLIEEMKSLGKVNVAFLPAGGTYTMNAVEAAEATQYIKPDLAIPYHWGQNVGTLADAQRFAQLASCPVKVMTVGETISSDSWPTNSPLVAAEAAELLR